MVWEFRHSIPWAAAHVDTGRHTAAPILLSESSAPVFGNQDAIRSTILARARCGVDRHRALQESVPRVKRRKRRNAFRQAGADGKPVTPLSPPPRHLQVKTDASVTIRPRIPTPAQRVSRICAETDVLAADADPEVLANPCPSVPTSSGAAGRTGSSRIPALR